MTAEWLRNKYLYKWPVPLDWGAAEGGTTTKTLPGGLPEKCTGTKIFSYFFPSG